MISVVQCLMYCFHRSQTSYDHHIWGCAGQFSLTLYVAAGGLNGRGKYQTSLIFADHLHDYDQSAINPIKPRLTTGDRRSHPRRPAATCDALNFSLKSALNPICDLICDFLGQQFVISDAHCYAFLCTKK